MVGPAGIGVALLAPAVAFIAACSSSSHSSAPSTGTTPPAGVTTASADAGSAPTSPPAGLPTPGDIASLPDPCAVVATADVTRIAHLKPPVTATPRATVGDKECNYEAADGVDTAAVALEPGGQTAFTNSRKVEETIGGLKCADVSGLGTPAYECPGVLSQITALGTKAIVDVSVTHIGGGDQAADTKALMQFVLPKF